MEWGRRTKRLEDALRRDAIYAVVRGGERRFGEQVSRRRAAEVILLPRRGRASAPRHYYVEAHGTGTVLGDCGAIASSPRNNSEGYCAIGLSSTNIGHLDPAACSIAHQDGPAPSTADPSESELHHAEPVD